MLNLKMLIIEFQTSQFHSNFIRLTEFLYIKR